MKLNWGFGIAAAYIIFVVCMILFAIKASQQDYDLVTDNYYEEAVKYQDIIDADKNASDTTSKLTVDYLSEKNAIELLLDGEIKKASGTISFYKPDKAKDDFKIDFTVENQMKQILELKKLAHGYWTLNISWKADGKNFIMEKRIFVN